MDTRRWLRAGDIFDRVFAAPRAERAALLDELCRTDPDLKQIVASMLDAEESALAFEQAAADIVRKGATTTEEATEAPAPGRVGPWRLVQKLGDGGMGVVWLAERADGQFEQQAALKLIKRGMDSDAVLARFLRERQILARLQHPNIAHLLDGGITDDGRPYFAMEYVDGKALLRYCHDNNLKLEDRIRLFLDVCAAVQFAHRHYVVHRDLKPSNVLVTANGDVKLLDFGIAKVLVDSGTGDATLTQARRERPMSPAYAAPEQFSGGTITEATDIYALGCVLYQLLTDKYAYDFRGAQKPDDMRRIIEASDPVAPSRLHLTAPPVPPKHLRGDLDTIVLAALKHEPARRYPSVAAFADDLRNYLDGKPISARRDHVLYRTYKYVRRHRVGVAATAAVILIGIVALLFELRARTGTIAPGSAVAIVDFSNSGQNKQHDWIAATLKNELATELEAGGKLHTLPGELVSAAHTDLPAPTAGGYAPASLTTLRQRLGTDYVLSGSYLVSGDADAPMLRLDLALQDAHSGSALAHLARSAPLSELPDLVEKAGAQLRSEVGVDVSDATTLQQVAKAQPATLELSRHMGLALDALARSDAARARDELVEAVAMAPGYAPAYVLLAQAWKKLGYDAKALAAAEQAAAHSEGLPQVQQLQIARELAAQKREWDKALAADRQLLTLDPANATWHLSLFNDLCSANSLDEAEAALGVLRGLPSMGQDPRVEIAAVKLANLRGDNHAQAQHAEAALKLAEARNYTFMAADATFDLAMARYRLGKTEDAVTLMQRAVAAYQRSANPAYEADARVWLGSMYTDLARLQAARDEYQAALNIYSRIGNKQGIADVYKDLAILLWIDGDRDASEHAATQARQFADEVGNSLLKAWTLTELASIRLDEAANDDALKLFRDALSINEEIGAHDQHVFALQNFAEALRLRGELKEAEKVCASAQAEGGQYKLLADYRCALVRLDLGDQMAAAAALQEVQSAAAAEEDVDTQINTAVQLAQIDMAQRNWGKARDRLVAVMEPASALPVGEVVAQSLLASSLRALHDQLGSDRALARARELRGRITARGAVFTADLQLIILKDAVSSARTVDALLALAQDADARFWVGPALEARISALQILEGADAPAASALRAQIAATARRHGYGWVLARLGDKSAIPKL